MTILVLTSGKCGGRSSFSCHKMLEIGMIDDPLPFNVPMRPCDMTHTISTDIQSVSVADRFAWRIAGSSSALFHFFFITSKLTFLRFLSTAFASSLLPTLSSVLYKISAERVACVLLYGIMYSSDMSYKHLISATVSGCVFLSTSRHSYLSIPEMQKFPKADQILWYETSEN